MPKHLLYLGNMLSGLGRTPTCIEALGPRLARTHVVYMRSCYLRKVARVADMIWGIIRYRKQVDAVLIDTYGTAAFWYAVACGRVCEVFGIPYIPILHGGSLPSRAEKSSIAFARLVDRAHRVVCLSGFLAAKIREFGVDPTCIPNSIDIDFYPFLHRREVRPRLLFVRSFNKIYNPAMLVTVVKQLSERYPNTFLSMVGPDVDGSLDHVRQRAKSEGVSDRIDFCGKLSRAEWVNLSTDFDIFVNPTNFDNQPVSVIEAMALGMPVISTNVGGIPFLVEHRKEGLLVEPESPNQMVDAITELVQDSNLASACSRDARKQGEKFDWATVGRQWEDLLETIPRI